MSPFGTHSIHAETGRMLFRAGQGDIIPQRASNKVYVYLPRGSRSFNMGTNRRVHCVTLYTSADTKNSEKLVPNRSRAGLGTLVIVSSIEIPRVTSGKQ